MRRIAITLATARGLSPVTCPHTTRSLPRATFGCTSCFISAIPQPAAGSRVHPSMRRLPLALTALLLLAPATAGAKPRDLLPDLAQGGPTGIDIVLDPSGATAQTRLVFDSTIGNVGEGPLILTAKRKSGT